MWAALQVLMSSAGVAGRGGQDTYPVDSVGEVPIKKMTQKYARNPEVGTRLTLAALRIHFRFQDMLDMPDRVPWADMRAGAC